MNRYVVLFLIRTEKMNANTLEKLLNQQAGLRALSGGECDTRQLQAAMELDDARASLAIHIFAGAKFIGTYARSWATWPISPSQVRSASTVYGCAT